MTKRFTNTYEWLMERYETEKELLLNEGLITSYPADTLLKKLRKKYKDAEYDSVNGFIYVDILLKDKAKLENILALYGYFIGDSDDQKDMCSIMIEPKFPAEIPIHLPHNINYIYHITTDIYLDKIKKIGLIPKKSTRPFYNHSGNRIYFLITDNPKTDLMLLKTMLCNNDARTLSNTKNNKMPPPAEYYALRMNFHALSNDLVFYRDPRMLPSTNFKGMGIFTLGNIPPDKIEILGKI